MTATPNTVNEPNVATDPNVVSDPNAVSEVTAVSETDAASETDVVSGAYHVYRARDTYFHGVRAKLAALTYSGGGRITHLLMCRGREVAKAMARERAETWARMSGRSVVDADLPGIPLIEEDPESPETDPQTRDGEWAEE